MTTSPELIRFVREALLQGRDRREIRDVLARAGWPDDQVRSAVAAFAELDFPVPVPTPRVSLSPRDAFLSLLQFASLYLVAFHLGSLVFQFIDRILPDPTQPVPDAYARDAMRWSISYLMVALPVFLLVLRIARREEVVDPARRLAPVRRWLTYLTVFLASCTIVGDVVGLVYRLLGGELTGRFVLKALTVGALAGTILGHYLSSLRRDERGERR